MGKYADPAARKAYLRAYFKRMRGWPIEQALYQARRLYERRA
jgi:hypothetical protein